MRHIREVIKTMPSVTALGGGLGEDGGVAARPYSQDTTFGAARQGPGIPVYRRGQRIGIVKDGCFYKVVRASRHLLRKPRPAWAFSVGTLHQAQRLGAQSVQVCDAETGRVYRASLPDIWRRGFRVAYDPNDDQVALPLEHWEVTGGAEARQLQIWGSDGDGR